MDAKHPLSVWLDDTGISRASFAQKVGISPSHLHLVCKRERGVSLSVAARIEQETKRAVRASDLVGPIHRPPPETSQCA